MSFTLGPHWVMGVTFIWKLLFILEKYDKQSALLWRVFVPLAHTCVLSVSHQRCWLLLFVSLT